ncbi:MAG: aspartyl/asparaginyl beta-hydroxylase domain-containing protein [Bdellovibrionaceae bacterium]|nr:aspartyl/asparaginyl beta-hydroxylase domain-containing protein [Pseudobdellovibrionaceae bacterium]
MQQIKAEVNSVLQDVSMDGRTVKQILLTCPTESTDYDFYGTGKIYDSVNKKYVIPQENFSVINPRLHGSYLEHVIKNFPYKIGRARIMILTQKHSYSLHRDAEPRFHIAVNTNPDCYLIYKDHPDWYHVPSDGYLYRVETHHMHSAMNCSEELRTHVVFDALEAY